MLSDYWLPALLATLGLMTVACGVLIGVLWRRVQHQRQAYRRLLEGLSVVQMAQHDYATTSENALGHLRDGLQTLTTVCANLDMRLHAQSLRASRRPPAKNTTAAQRRDFDTAIELARAGREPTRIANAAQLSAAESALVCAVHTQDSPAERGQR